MAKDHYCEVLDKNWALNPKTMITRKLFQTYCCQLKKGFLLAKR